MVKQYLFRERFQGHTIWSSVLRRLGRVNVCSQCERSIVDIE